MADIPVTVTATPALLSALNAWADQLDRQAIETRTRHAGRLADDYRQQGRALGWNDCARTVRAIVTRFEGVPGDGNDWGLVRVGRESELVADQMRRDADLLYLWSHEIQAELSPPDMLRAAADRLRALADEAG